METEKSNPVVLLGVRAAAARGIARRLRLAGRLSLSDIAIHVGASTSAVQRWETGERAPRGEPARKYFELLSEMQELLG